MADELDLTTGQSAFVKNLFLTFRVLKNAPRKLIFFSGCALLASITGAGAQTESVNPSKSHDSKSQSKAHFTYKNSAGETATAPLVAPSEKRRIVEPLAKIDPNLDPKLARAATIAQDRANAHSKSRCWHYVKDALVASGAITSRPTTALAKQAGDELVRSFGFKKLPIRDPFAAPIGAVLVYNAKGAAGHVELRTKNGFVSDFRTKKPSRRPLIGIYAKA
jgi:hypothetical protein